MADKALSSDAFDKTVALSTGRSTHSDRGVDDDPLVGVELANAYRIERVLAEGGMGRLYEAEHLRIDRRLAVKVIHHPLAQRDDMRARFEREARAMGRVRSEHVVSALDVVKAPDGRTCIVTELLDGRDLEQRLAQGDGKLTTGEAVALMRQCLRGLGAAHALGVVHRDLKPSNLFLATDAQGHVTLKILDFGVAKLGGDAEMTNTGVIVGTPAYMAPEQARGATHADARSDLYAVGAVLYRAVTGRSPYGGSDSHGTLVRLMEESPERPRLIEKTIPAGLEAVIEKAMARDPEQRFQTAAELDRALTPFDDAGGALRGALGARGVETEPLVDAKTLGRRARLARPAAVLLACAASVAMGSSVASALALLVDSVSDTPVLQASEVVLIALAAGVATSAAAIALGRALSSVWRNGAMVQALSSRLIRALSVGCATLGALELAASSWAAFALLRPSANGTTWAATRIIAALAAAALTVFRARRS